MKAQYESPERCTATNIEAIVYANVPMPIKILLETRCKMSPATTCTMWLVYFTCILVMTHVDYDAAYSHGKHMNCCQQCRVVEQLLQIQRNEKCHRRKDEEARHQNHHDLTGFSKQT